MAQQRLITISNTITLCTETYTHHIHHVNKWDIYHLDHTVALVVIYNI